MSEMLRGSPSERRKIRNIVYSGSAQISISQNDDGTWFADIYDAVIEADSPAELFQEIAKVLVES
jgi:hypothetical protein